MTLFFKSQNFDLYHGDCTEILPKFKEKSFNLIFADPPYNLSNGGISCSGGKMVSVNKGDWDKSKGFDEDFKFSYKWLFECKRILKDDGIIWVSGTHHSIYQIGYALKLLGFEIINEIIWFKPNAPPNLSCRYFAHSHETLICAKKIKEAKHYFDYNSMKKWDDKISPIGKQMKSIWNIPLTPQREKIHGKHPTQKPLELLKRIIIAHSKKGDSILDPFNGSGTTGIVATEFERKYVGIEIDKNYLELTKKRYNSLNNSFYK
ncbi:MAG TPA: DNA methyltransferase [Candidatus Nanoarchaeia archaeon]|nr:DNA methyltransferase [Candidatus Nanoarchaeia archaeon]